MKTPESAVLHGCLDYLRIHHHLVARINNGAFETKRGGWVRCTDIPGIADIIGITIDGKALAVECKSDKGRLSKSQEIFRIAWMARGGMYVLARSIKDLQEAGL
jgi:hypothetical protein